MKKSLTWLVIIVIIVTAIIIYSFSGNWSDLDRETYENTRYGFSFMYPADWTLGEAETNNTGVEIYSPNDEALCYAYGFENALINEMGEPQTLNEFINWLTDKGNSPDIVEVLQRNDSTLGGQLAIRLLIERRTDYQQAIYTMGKETGIGFYCIYPDLDKINNYSDEFDQMMTSFEITSSLDG